MREDEDEDEVIEQGEGAAYEGVEPCGELPWGKENGDCAENGEEAINMELLLTL